MIAHRRTFILESLAVIATVSLLTSWGMRPFFSNAMAAQGTLAQSATLSALWLSAVLSPITALVKASAAALVCWAVAVYLDERILLGKLVSIFCVAETLFCIRDLALWGILSLRGIESVRSAADMSVPFGLNAFVPATSLIARISVGSWDLFHIAWLIVIFTLIRISFDIRTRSAVCLALAALAFRILFAAAAMLYGS